MTTSLLQLRSRVRDLIDDENGVLVSDASLNDYINRSGARWHYMIVQAYPFVFENLQTLTPTGSNPFDSSLPSDYYKTLGVRYLDDDDETYHLRRLDYKDRNKYIAFTNKDQAYGYYLRQDSILLAPGPGVGSKNYEHDYIRNWRVLSLDGDIVMTGGVNVSDSIMDSWVHWIVYDVAIEVRSKEESDVSQLMAQRSSVENDLFATIQDLDAANPQVVHDVYTELGYTEGLVGYGFHDRWDFWRQR